MDVQREEKGTRNREVKTPELHQVERVEKEDSSPDKQTRVDVGCS